MGFAYLVITPDRKYLVAYSIDGQRFLDEQVPGQDWEPVTMHWHQGSPEAKVRELTRGLKVAADSGLPGARHCGTEIVDLHYPLTDLDLKRSRWVGRASNGILSRVARDIGPGMTEREIGARILYEYALAGMTVDVLIVGADERISHYRHVLPTENVLRRYALLHPGARRWGLHANVTRLVHFGQPPDRITRAVEAATGIAGHVATMLAPGVRFAEVLDEQKRLYEAYGYPDEWNYHFQGGITGYVLADAARSLNPEARVAQRQAFDYFVTITGAKSEELFLLTEDGLEVASWDESWPSRTVRTLRGEVTVPDMMVR